MIELIDAISEWMARDPDPLTRADLAAALERLRDGRGSAEEVSLLRDAFSGPLTFGTAGLRAALGPGPNRMNLAVVVSAAAGIGRWVNAAPRPEGRRPRVVIGFDARTRSDDFARASAEVLAADGIEALVLPGPLPTPVAAFAVRHLGAAAGIMVTASHNPAADNGYKVYDSSGRQIAPPTDREIADLIASVGPAIDVPRAPTGDPNLVRLGSEVVEAYVAAAAQMVTPGRSRRVRIAHTSLHGVGAATFRRVVDRAGFPAAVEVAEQSEPDPTFPTVAFPNPEEPGAMDLGLELAATSGADVLLANDPDADRLGVAVPDPALGAADRAGGWRALSGDEIGVLLAWHLIRAGRVGPDDVVATTIVSSTLLAKMAAHHGLAYAETLTGFKWISRAAGPGRKLAFGYEEALGYCVGDAVADKDGISAAVVFAELVADLAEEGRTVLDVLDDLAVAHGVHRTGQWVVRVAGPDAMGALGEAMVRLRSAAPPSLAGRPVVAVTDLLAGDGERGLAPSDVVALSLEGARVVVRPSGTEPKLKCYLEVVEPCDRVEELAAARARADDTLGRLTAAVADLVT